ncbi:MAG: hypothetical protein R2845_16295 [Thermomicrobiales bacterium]
MIGESFSTRGWKTLCPSAPDNWRKWSEEVSFNAPDYRGQRIEIDSALVNERIGEIQDDEDLSEYIL